MCAKRVRAKNKREVSHNPVDTGSDFSKLPQNQILTSRRHSRRSQQTSRSGSWITPTRAGLVKTPPSASTRTTNQRGRRASVASETSPLRLLERAACAAHVLASFPTRLSSVLLEFISFSLSIPLVRIDSTAILYRVPVVACVPRFLLCFFVCSSQLQYVGAYPMSTGLCETSLLFFARTRFAHILFLSFSLRNLLLCLLILKELFRFQLIPHSILSRKSAPCRRISCVCSMLVRVILCCAQAVS